MSEINIAGAAELLNSPDGKKIMEKRGELERLAATADGKKVRELLGGDKIEQAAKSGDIASIAASLQAALKTEEGARLAERLRELMK